MIIYEGKTDLDKFKISQRYRTIDFVNKINEAFTIVKEKDDDELNRFTIIIGQPGPVS